MSALLEVEDLERPGGAEDSQPVGPVVPEVVVAREGEEPLQERPDLARRVQPPQRRLRLAEQVAVADRVLPVVGVVSMRRLVERDARRLVVGQQRGLGW